MSTHLVGCCNNHTGTEELHKFTHDPECFCMLLGRDGSEGLDLSFVTRKCSCCASFLFFKFSVTLTCIRGHADIFFLEEIWDKALAEQTVARAWRMGAKGPVEVETILAYLQTESYLFRIRFARGCLDLQIPRRVNRFQ